jgi:predicted metallopeptidase
MTTVKYWQADDVEEVAAKLIAEHHTDLRDIDIKYVFRDTASKSRGNIVLGKARKVSGLNAALVALVGRKKAAEGAEFFVVEIAHDMWTTLTKEQRIALVDHELCHFEVEYPEDAEKERTIHIGGHDVEEFTAVIERHGAWRPPIEELVRASGEMPGQTVIVPDDASALTE